MLARLFLLLLTFSLQLNALDYDDTTLPPPPFEKIYVSPSEVICTSQGTFYITQEDNFWPVRSIRRDAYGTYVILITQECPICGRWSASKDAPEGYSCPYFQSEVRPHIWCDH